MVKLNTEKRKAIREALAMWSDEVLDFSDVTFKEFFSDEFDIDIYEAKYSTRGDSEADRLMSFLENEQPVTVSRVLHKLLEYKNTLCNWDYCFGIYEDQGLIDKILQDMIKSIEKETLLTNQHTIVKFHEDDTLDELVASLQAEISAGRLSAALDRLHTYCMKYFSHLLEEAGKKFNPKTTALHSRVGLYVKHLKETKELTPITERAIKSSISVFEQYNDIRNNRSLAHDNELVSKIEAKFIFDTVTSILYLFQSLSK